MPTNSSDFTAATKRMSIKYIYIYIYDIYTRVVWRRQGTGKESERDWLWLLALVQLGSQHLARQSVAQGRQWDCYFYFWQCPLPAALRRCGRVAWAAFLRAALRWCVCPGATLAGCRLRCSDCGRGGSRSNTPTEAVGAPVRGARNYAGRKSSGEISR